MRKIAATLVGLALVTGLCAQTFDVDRQLGYCHNQVKKALKSLSPYNFSMEPRNILDGQTTWNCHRAVAEEWCSGFWPGILWMDYSYSADAEVRRAAEGYTEVLRPLASRPVHDHDLGFIMTGSFGKGAAHCPDVADGYRPVLLAAADSLATLYNGKVGTLLSWPHQVRHYGGHNTIIDNMLNLELLFWAAANGGSPLLRQVAVSHATTTLRNHLRPDGSSYHVVVYDTHTGAFLRGVTHQGYADGSMWSRGQSWAIYGFTMAYRWTRDPLFLETAQKAADVYLRRLRQTSDDMVPLWDMDAPGTQAEPKDASAACIVASALIELSTFLDGWRSQQYRDAAVKMLADLSTPRYQSGDSRVAFLLHATGHRPASSEVDASIIYADYYYLEALLRLKELYKKK